MTSSDQTCRAVRIPLAAASNSPSETEAPAQVESREAKGGETLRQLAVRGSLWVAGSLLIVQVIKVLSNVVLARLLNPEIFGLVTVAAVIGLGLELFSDIGIGSLIIQHQRGDEPRFLNTVWTIQVLRGLMIAAILALIAVPIARLYENSTLAMVLILSSGTAMISGFNSTALYTMNRNLAVWQICTLNILCDAMATGATILFALVTPTVWAVMFGGYVRAIIRLGTSHWLNTDVPNRFGWDAESRHALLTFGKWHFVSSGIVFFANQADRLLLGRLGSMETLGIYGLAMTVATTPQLFGQKLAQMVLYPLFAKQAREDVALLERKVLRARRLVLSAGLSAVLAAVLASPWFFHFLYDERYWEAGWLAQVLCFYTWFSGLQLSADRALLAVGDTRSLALSNAVNLGVTILGCVGGYWLGGLLGFTIGLCFSTLASHVIIQVALARRGIHVARQDAVYTFWLLTLSAVGAIGPRIVATLVGSEPSLGMSLTLGLSALTVAGCWTLWVAWEEVLKR